MNKKSLLLLFLTLCFAFFGVGISYSSEDRQINLTVSNNELSGKPKERDEIKKDLQNLLSKEAPQIEKTTDTPKETTNIDTNDKIINAVFWGISNNEKVEYFLNYFKTKIRDRFKIYLSRSAKYLPLISKIFEEHGVAQELIFLPLIESGFSPYATSRAQAVGIWQFMKGTAIKYGLRVDKFVDERRDPEKSARAAARYLKDLYNIFGSWDFALAAYNAGEGKIMRTMSSVGSQDFWDVISHRKIKRETKEYVPRFIAASIIAKEPEKHGFDDVNYEPSREYEEVLLPPQTTLSSIAKAIDENEDVIKSLNPSIKHGFLPPDTYYPVKIPKEKKDMLTKNIHLLEKANSKLVKKIMAQKEKKTFAKKHKSKKIKDKKLANDKTVNHHSRS